MPHALLNLDGAGVKVQVPPFQSEHFRDPRTGGNTGFDYQLVRVFKVSEHAHRLVEGEDPALVLVPFLAELGSAGGTPPAFLSEPVALGAVEDSSHSACFLEMAPSPLLGPTSWYFRSVYDGAIWLDHVDPAPEYPRPPASMWMSPGGDHTLLYYLVQVRIVPTASIRAWLGVVTCHYDYGSEFQTLGETHRADRSATRGCVDGGVEYLERKSRPSDRSASPVDFAIRVNEDADLVCTQPLRVRSASQALTALISSSTVFAMAIIASPIHQ